MKRKTKTSTKMLNNSKGIEGMFKKNQISSSASSALTEFYLRSDSPTPQQINQLSQLTSLPLNKVIQYINIFSTIHKLLNKT
jgi:hypothetical protein